jgi:hypothetical protein
MSGVQFLAGWYTPVGQPSQGLPPTAGQLPSGSGNYPSQGLPGAPNYPSQGLPGAPNYPSQGLPGAPNYPSQGLPGGGNYPSHPIEIPPGIDNSLPPIPDHTLPPGEVSPPVGPGSAANTGYVPMYVPDDDKWHWLSVPLPHVDQGLPPGQPGSPDNTLPGGGEHPSQGLPVTPPAGGIGGTPPPRPGPQPPAPGQLPSSMRQR